MYVDPMVISYKVVPVWHASYSRGFDVLAYVPACLHELGTAVCLSFLPNNQGLSYSLYTINPISISLLMQIYSHLTHKFTYLNLR